MLIEFADALEFVLEIAVIAQPLLDDGDLRWAEADVLGSATGIGDREDRDRVTVAVGANRATGAMADVAVEE
ncbi:MAG: hypothetical protein U0Q16_25695 [Bryobacteraceae bacterium]